MQQNYNEDSFKKGEQFERYIEEVIFPEAHYEVVDKTSDSEQNTRRFVRKSLEPDFHFKCRVSGKEFYVEAKWRAKPYKDLYEILSEKQFKSFPNKDSNEIPIFIAFGYGGQAFNPDYVSLIPLKSVSKAKLSPSDVYAYNIEKTYRPYSFLIEEKQETKDSQKRQDSLKEEKEKRSKGPDIKLLGLAAIGLLTIIVTIFGFAFSEETPEKSSEAKLKLIVADYYQSMNSNQIEKLPKFLSPKIVSWYGDKDPTQEEIMRNATAHRGKYPYSSSDIDWNSFKVIEESNGDYHVSYEMIYKAKQDINDDYQVFDLKLITKWDEDFKLKSISEIRR